MALENLYGKIHCRVICAPVQVFYKLIFIYYQFDKELQPLCVKQEASKQFNMSLNESNPD